MLLECLIFWVGMPCFMTGAQYAETEVLTEADSRAVLPCKSDISSQNNPVIIWRKVNKGTVWRKQKNGLQYWGTAWSPSGIQRALCPHSKFERDDYSLQIDKVREDDAGLYSCTVENDGQVLKKLITLRVIKVSISPSGPMWDNDVFISCNVTPMPYGASVWWMLNNSPFVKQSKITLNHNITKSVVREKVTVRLTGNWTCVVSYRGEVGKASVSLTPKGIIQPPNDNTKVYAALGSAATLPCAFSPGLIPTKLVWERRKPGSFFKPDPSRFSFSPSSSSFNRKSDKSAALKEVWLEDEGMYRCSGTVNGQQLRRNMQLVVAHIHEEKKERGSVKLTCQLTDTSEVTAYEWVHVVYDQNGTQSLGSIQKGMVLTLTPEPEKNQGEWTCRYYGKDGILGNLTYPIQLMSGLSGQKLSGLSGNAGPVVGLCILLLVLLLVLIKMLKNHQRRKRILPYPALETIVHSISNEREERERSREKK